MTELFTDFGLRDWLLILGPIFIAGILIHGYWRMRTNRNTLKMSLDKSFVSDAGESAETADELSMLRAELPNGGARVRTPEQTSLNLQEKKLQEKNLQEPKGQDEVPLLVDPVDDEPEVRARRAAEPSRARSAQPKASAVTPDAAEKSFQDELAEPSESESPAESLIEPPLPRDLPEKYMVVNVMSIGEPFRGQELLECLVEQDMALGEMNIFHRERNGQTQFSLMNAVEPGSFDLNEMSQIETPAVSMFMRVHELRKPRQVFEQMLQVADALAEELGGEVRDETRSVMTSQTIEHCRQELAEYEFKNPA